MPSFTSPIPAALITSGWGAPREYRGGTHAGLDFKAPIGTPVKAIEAGTVFRAKNVSNSYAGKWVGLRHGGFASRYLHLSNVAVSVGQKVSKGQIVGYSGDTGISQSAPHLHFDLSWEASQHPLIPFGLPATGDWAPLPLWYIPAEPFVPGNYSEKVITQAKSKGLSIASGWAYTGLATVAAGGAALWWWLRRKG